MILNSEPSFNTHFDSSLQLNIPNDHLIDCHLKITCISFVLSASLPVHARSLAIRLICLGACNSVGCNIPKEDLAKLEGICKSTVIRMSKLLSQLNIFTVEEHRDKPCVFFFNPDKSSWLQYTTPAPILKAINGKSTESQITNNQDYGDADSLNIVNVQDVDESVDSVDFVSDADEVMRSCRSASESNYRTLKGKDEEREEIPALLAPYTANDCIWRREGAYRYCQIPPIHDEPTGMWIQSEVESTGYTPQKVVIEAVKTVKGVRLLLAVAIAIADDVCAKVAIAIEKVLSKPPEKPVRVTKSKEDKEISQRQWEDDRLEEWWKANRDSLGYADYPYNCLPVINGVVSVTQDGGHKPLTEIIKSHNNKQSKRHLQAV